MYNSLGYGHYIFEKGIINILLLCRFLYWKITDTFIENVSTQNFYFDTGCEFLFMIMFKDVLLRLKTMQTFFFLLYSRWQKITEQNTLLSASLTEKPFFPVNEWHPRVRQIYIKYVNIQEYQFILISFKIL